MSRVNTEFTLTGSKVQEYSGTQTVAAGASVYLPMNDFKSSKEVRAYALSDSTVAASLNTARILHDRTAKTAPGYDLNGTTLTSGVSTGGLIAMRGKDDIALGYASLLLSNTDTASHVIQWYLRGVI